MPSGSDFKYSTGDTTLWKSKYYAFVDYALSVGASVADIEAFLAENSSFTPGTAPTALASLNAVTAATSDNLEYQISHGTPYESLTANLWFLVRMPSGNAGAMTLKVDALAAKSVYVGGNPMAGGELAAGGAYFFAYNATADRFDVVGATGSPVKSVTLDDTDSVYTLLSPDLGGVHTVAVDISGGSVDVKELSLPAMSGIVRYVIVSDAGSDSPNRFRLLDSGDTEIATGYRKGYFIDCAYDGTNRHILAEPEVIARIWLRKTANQNIANNGARTNVYQSNYAVKENDGALYDTVTNHRLDLPFDARVRITDYKVSEDSGAVAGGRLNGSNTEHLPSGTRSSQNEKSVQWFDCSAGDYLELTYYNNLGGSATVEGAAGENKSYAIFEVMRRR